ncbi:flagellar type III secretion system protein FliR [Pontibacillus yanchengensis]|uniref:Flagellar type III secretion system protein FliR n=2 Tax=Pontibacillus yanchengensis TaxID=462910 RepID=A0ACC7VBA8_9BACI|nr:flagellar biosynthetic protein FliR [Pontibacillus yanchengensis]MYL33157.1 flagellar type III secretion system protein FliR [Pontibacillus yanchengensis]MYL51993.1 flagellar type III secretion system protein FliR [Pontibacillus yanchengensis]
MLEFIDLNKLPAFLLIFVRVTAFFVTIPIFSYKNVPTQHKVGFSFFLAWIMYYTIDIPEITIDGTFYILLLKETLVGLAIGFIAYLVLAAIQIAGGFIDFQMGFAIANVIDPRTGVQSPLIGQYLYTVTLLFLLAVNAHHMLIDGVFYSYELIPIESLDVGFSNQSMVSFVIETFNQMFVIAFQMAVPIVGCLFLVDVALGIVARTVPQLNVFVVGLPLKIFVSFVVILISFGMFTILIRDIFEMMLMSMRGLMRIMGGA